MMSVSVRVRYFAALRETTERDEESLALPGDGQEASVADARALLLERYPTLATILPRCAVAINRSYVAADATLHNGDELAFIPPLGGG